MAKKCETCGRREEVMPVQNLTETASGTKLTPCPDCQKKPQGELAGCLRNSAGVLEKRYHLTQVVRQNIIDNCKQAATRIEELEPLIEACQGAIIIINELTTIIDDFVEAKDLPAFPHPPIDGIKQAITNAGGVIFETTEQAKAALGKETENE